MEHLAREPAGIRKEHVQNTSLEYYRYVSLLGLTIVNEKVDWWQHICTNFHEEVPIRMHYVQIDTGTV
jgi:hypothetical protein